MSVRSLRSSTKNQNPQDPVVPANRTNNNKQVYAFCAVILLLILCIVYLLLYPNHVEYITSSDHENIRLFYEGFPSDGYYFNCLERVKKYSINYLEQKFYVPERTLVVDFDDTIVYTRPFQPLHPKPYRRRSFQQYHQAHHQQPLWHYPPIPQVVDILRCAKTLQYMIIVLTARRDSMLHDTVTNAETFGVYADKYILLNGNRTQKQLIYHSIQKLTKLECLEYSTDQILQLQPDRPFADNHINIILTIGDQWDDVFANKHGTIGIKLPDPYDMNVYRTTHLNRFERV